jgi:Zn-dependent protease
MFGVLCALEVGSASVTVFGFVTLAWLVSLCLHEFAHALAAYIGGDTSVAAKGYLTLNPLRYTNIGLSLLLPVLFLILGGIGLPGGAVWIDRAALRSKRMQSLCALAGPCTNLLVAVAMLLPARLGIVGSGRLGSALAFVGYIQIWAAFLNLLPVPSLDGYAAIEPYLPRRFRAAIYPYRFAALLVLFLLVNLVRPFGHAFHSAAISVVHGFGVSTATLRQGFLAYQVFHRPS